MKLQKFETILNQEAWNRVGGLSQPSKMPCYGYSIPAQTCKLGSVLQKVQGTTCFKCYAMKGRYVMPNVKAALQRRYHALMHSETWTDDMVRVIRWKEKSGYFRWHDSGDLQSAEHLRKIAIVALALPDIRFWLPTREAGILKAYFVAYGTLPDNLTVRLSATKIDAAAPSTPLPTSTVVSDPAQATCKAPSQGGECKDCRACWSKEVKNVSYKRH